LGGVQLEFPATQQRPTASGSGAIAAGNPNTTPPTYLCGGEPTDIPEDFSVPSGTPLVLVVPPGATHLFTSTADILFYDNEDPDGDYKLRITTLPTSVVGSSWGAVKGLYRADQRNQ
jgi:hypothetical protein